MTNPNWWDVEPLKYQCHKSCGDTCCEPYWQYNVPAIIAEVEKRGETKEKHFCAYNCKGCLYKWWAEDLNYDFCPHCGAKIIWS